MANEIETILKSCETLLLDGEKFPYGKKENFQESQDRIQKVAPLIVQSYQMIKSVSDGKNLLKRIFYLARGIERDLTDDEETSLKIRNIANIGRKLSLANPQDVQERVRLAKLFSYANDIFAAQLKDPKRGCSSSVCTNCDETIAFMNFQCYVCDYELIGAHGMPSVEQWKQMAIPQRIKSFEKGYNHMIEDIHQRGDWRGEDSPLNRFKPKNVSWGSGRIKFS